MEGNVEYSGISHSAVALYKLSTLCLTVYTKRIEISLKLIRQKNG
jgi:hypothetical protein